MIAIPRNARVFLATQPTDLRKGFDGLMALVQNVIEQDPFSCHLFVFRNQRRDRLKILWWDKDGLAIFYKRLERGAYQFPTDPDVVAQRPLSQDAGQHRHEIRADQLSLLLDGIDLKNIVRRPRYQRPTPSDSTAVPACSN